MEQIEVAIIGAGIVGLAIAAELSKKYHVLVLEKNQKYGLETSSRNSEVIHAGIYYTPGSLKARLCVEGNRSIYKLCAQYGIGHKRLGKVIVATDEIELPELYRLMAVGRANDVPLEMVTADEIHRLEPNVNAIKGIFSPTTGIIDSHGLMRHFQSLAQRNGAIFAYKSSVIGIAKEAKTYRVTVADGEDGFSFLTNVLVNSAGLNCHHIAAMAGIDINKAGYQLHYCKGEYFSLTGDWVSRLVYPIPEVAGGPLGVHVTIDLGGRVRLGPNSTYTDEIEYKVDESKKDAFYHAVRKILPGVRIEDLSPDIAGVRPRLQGPAEGSRDFVIQDESDKGFRKLINLIGIESPGLTASPAIARYVSEIVDAVA